MHTLAAVGAGLAALAFAALVNGASVSEPDDGWTKLHGEAALAEAPCPEPESLPAFEPSEEKLAAARGR